MTLLEPFERVRDGASAVIHIPTARHAYLTTLLGELEALDRDPVRPGDTLAAVQRSLLTLILAEVDVVAERVGYADATHFIRMFRREHGTTPAAWRAAHARGRHPGS